MSFYDFWDRVHRPKHGCWTWTGATNADGYGWLWWEGRNHLAHRISWELTYGEIPENLCVLHHCDNPPCVHPHHLWLGTRQENNQDKTRKGRAQRLKGERNGRAKLTKELVLKLREMHKEGWSSTELADKFGIPKSTTHHAISGRTWSHL